MQHTIKLSERKSCHAKQSPNMKPEDSFLSVSVWISTFIYRIKAVVL